MSDTNRIDTVLVANRGEIAVRVIRTLKDMGLRSVAVFSEADRTARHVREADTAVLLGPAAARESYLAIDKVIDAAVATGAQAIHPGYGFLSENAAFAAACATAGIAFLGPSAHAIETMGDKITAKSAVSEFGVPVVPGISRPGLTDADLIAGADEVGYPVLVKPSAGGGGKGMRLVTDPADLPAALASAEGTLASYPPLVFAGEARADESSAAFSIGPSSRGASGGGPLAHFVDSRNLTGKQSGSQIQICKFHKRKTGFVHQIFHPHFIFKLRLFHKIIQPERTAGFDGFKQAA